MFFKFEFELDLILNKFGCCCKSNEFDSEMTGLKSENESDVECCKRFSDGFDEVWFETKYEFAMVVELLNPWLENCFVASEEDGVWAGFVVEVEDSEINCSSFDLLIRFVGAFKVEAEADVNEGSIASFLITMSFVWCEKFWFFYSLEK